MDLSSKNIVVIGGGGIGLATSRLLLQKKIANLIITDCLSSLPELNDLRNKYPGTAISYFNLDITKKEDVKKIFSQIFQKFKKIDVVLNAAGVLDDHKPELTINVNLWGLVNTTLTAYAHMDKSKGGQGGLIVNIASVLGLMPCPPLAVYSATKAGVISFTRSLAGEYYHSKSGVSLTAICPGCTDTPMTENLMEKSTFPYDYDVFSILPPQPVEICAENVVRAIEKNQNGSIWICNEGKFDEVKPVDSFRPGP